MELSELVAALKESDKIRLYLVSLLGVAQDRNNLTTFHYAEVFEAQSIDMVRRMACERIHELWPREKGFVSRTVTIDPIQPDPIKRVLQFWQSGLLAKQIDPPEDPIEVNCDTGRVVRASHPQNE